LSYDTRIIGQVKLRTIMDSLKRWRDSNFRKEFWLKRLIKTILLIRRKTRWTMIEKRCKLLYNVQLRIQMAWSPLNL